ncbi:hypothetical protein HMPREF0765_2035 [Sphingobacterium spiritivorum ATCC 33300]|uniref:Uncharacterized protein n=1 Tax=Sphingobacterium spiritivorum ATCC 33300 TaxID=525372 RepID=C2FXH9_SPHSI|nr:hypothetical protein [Sphingobacterium spiritivorum]EEI92420.1 hypothetical protein HMPREF0765_2035 [Sphingobacterium spiritivorum ATCC 33300]QQS96831.1 hypothetical protein I6J03_03705 [Sphingobacterium spiritivorum]
MKKNFIANELKVGYHSNPKLSCDDFKYINNSKLMDKTFRVIWDMEEFEIRESFMLYISTQSLMLLDTEKLQMEDWML